MSLPDLNSYPALGGEKVDYSPPEDPTTDRAADEINDAFSDVAAMTRTVVRCYVAFSVSSGVCTVLEHDSVWGNDNSVAPTVAAAAAGTYDITWPATVVDARGTSHGVNLRRGVGNVETAGFVPSVLRTAANVVRVYLTYVGTNALTDPGSSYAIVVTAW